jgi:hypothetical protein
MNLSGEIIDLRQAATVNVARAAFGAKWWNANLGNRRVLTSEEETLAQCAGRVTNRIGADIRRADCIAVKQLAARLADRLGSDIILNSEALLWLASTIFGFYRGAEDYLKGIKLKVQRKL